MLKEKRIIFLIVFKFINREYNSKKKFKIIYMFLINWDVFWSLDVKVIKVLKNKNMLVVI